MRPLLFNAFDAVEMLTPAAAATSWIVIRFFVPPVSRISSLSCREKTFYQIACQVRKGFLTDSTFPA
jgi:hypothetical protein